MNLLGDNIKRIRLSKGIGLNEVARRANITGGYLSSIENNKRTNIGAEILESIATAIGVSVSDFYSDYENPCLTHENGIKLSVGDKLRVLRKQNNLTLKELSEKTNLSISFISDIENKRRNPSIDNLKLLANALNVSVSDLLDEKLYTPKANKFNDDDDLRRIERARNKMNPEQKEKMMDILRTVFDDLFDD